MNSQTKIVSYVLAGDIYAVMGVINELRDQDILDIVEENIKQFTQKDQDLLVIVCVLGDKSGLMKKIISSFTFDPRGNATRMFESKLTKSIYGFGVFSYFVYEKPNFLLDYLEFQKEFLEYVPIIPKDLISCLDLELMKDYHKELLVGYLLEYYRYFNDYQVEFYSFDETESYHEAFFRLLLDFPEFLEKIDLEVDLENFSIDHIVLGLEFIEESQEQEFYENRQFRIAVVLEERFRIFYRRRELFIGLMMRLSVSPKIGSTVFKRNLTNLIKYFDFESLIKIKPELFV